MSLFDNLPTVSKCCLCINLKCGTVIIGILGMFSFGLGAARLLSHHCLAAERGTLAEVIKIYAYVVAVVQVVLLITSILLIVGVIISNQSTATWFMYAAGFAVFALLVGVILLIVNKLVSSLCPLPYAEIIYAIVSILIWIHFISVVKSYQSEM